MAVTKTLVVFLLPLLFVSSTKIPTNECSLSAENLRVERSVTPFTDELHPLLSWTLRVSDAQKCRGVVQTSYTVTVSSTPERLAADDGDLWRAASARSTAQLEVEYRGDRLRSGQRAYWKVVVEGEYEGPSSGSAAAAAGKVASSWWEMALLEKSDWKGEWIGSELSFPKNECKLYEPDAAPLLRTEFLLASAAHKARVYISGLGYYELYLNGKRVGDSVLDPGWTTYNATILYSVYDITDLLREGRNAVGIWLGNGWYNPLPMTFWERVNLREALPIGTPRALMQMNIEFANGKTQSVFTSGGKGEFEWTMGDSPILRNNIYLGEDYDARLEQPDWATVGFDDSHWRSAVVPDSTHLGRLRAQYIPPIRQTATVPAVKVMTSRGLDNSGVYIVDFGHNFAGVVRMKAKEKAGKTISMRYGELLYENGTLNGLTSVAGQVKGPGQGGPCSPDIAWQGDRYTFAGREEGEIITQRFTWHAFRYMEISGLSYEPSVDDFEGLEWHSDLEEVSSFESSNDLLNRIHDMVKLTMKANLYSVHSDCPHRERFGYGGDALGTSQTAVQFFDMSQFYSKRVYDFADAERPNGGFAETAPYVGVFDTFGTPLGSNDGPVEWGSLHPHLLALLYKHYGTTRLLKQEYADAKHWVSILADNAPTGILDNGLGDWMSMIGPPTALSGTAFYHFNLQLLHALATVLAEEKDAEFYKELAATVSDAFNSAFYNADGSYTDASNTTTQAAQVYALYLDLVPPHERDKVLLVLLDNIYNEWDGHLSTGMFATGPLFKQLSMHGFINTAFSVATQPTFPGWGYMLSMGATTVWESWDFSNDTFSHNHPMFGTVVEWMYEWLLGIQSDSSAGAVAFDHILLTPSIPDELAWANGSYTTSRGTVRSGWVVSDAGDRLTLSLTIPPNTRASLHLPLPPLLREGRGGRAGRHDLDIALERVKGSGSRGTPATLPSFLASVTESGLPLLSSPHIRVRSFNERTQAVICSLGSGEYEFVLPWSVSA